MENVKSAVFAEILREAGVLDWLIDQLGIDQSAVIEQADKDFETLIVNLSGI